jgi:hypothetical protein
MKTTTKNITTADYFFGLLSNLNSDCKLELIARLSNSLKTKPEKKETTLRELFGSFKSSQTAEEIIEDLRSSRNFKRKIEKL